MNKISIFYILTYFWQVAGALSALREQYKNFRAKENPDGTTHIGDTRTEKERKDTMDANKKGREKALKSEKDGQSRRWII